MPKENAQAPTADKNPVGARLAGEEALKSCINFAAASAGKLLDSPEGAAEGCDLLILVARKLAPLPQQRPALLRTPRFQPPPQHIQHITPIPQGDGAEQCKVAEDED